MAPRTTKKLRTLRGTVVSNAADKTAIVRVTRTLWHPKYHRQYAMSRRYPVHDEQNACRVGDVVEFTETRPLSKTKRWRIIEQGKSQKGKVKSD